MQNRYSHLTDPIVQAGFGIARGQPISEAITMAAEMEHKNAVAENQRQQALQMQHSRSQDQLRAGREAQLAQILPQVLQELDPSDLQGNIGKLQQAGLPLNDALALASKVSEYAVKSNQPSPFEQKLALENEKKNNRLEEKKTLKNDKFLEQNDAKAKEAEGLLTTLSQLEELSPQFHQGVGSDIAYTANKLAGNQKAAAYEQFNAASKALALKAGEKLKGAFSDKDIIFLEKQVPNSSNTREGNKKIIDGLRRAAKREIEYTEKANQWVSEGGDIREFNKDWRKYVNENPIFGEKQEKRETEDFSSRSEEDIEAEIRKLESEG